MLRNLLWKTVKSVRIGGGRASLVARRYRKYHANFFKRAAVHYAVIWERNHQEGFPALLAGGWSGDKKKCEELFAEIQKRAQAFRRQIRASMNYAHGKTFGELRSDRLAQEKLFVLLSDASLEIQQGRLTLAEISNVGT